MAEAIPILGGVLLGIVVHGCRGRMPAWFTAALIAVLAASATIANGEYRVSPAYLLVDAALVIAGAALFLIAVRPIRPPKRNHETPEPQS